MLGAATSYLLSASKEEQLEQMTVSRGRAMPVAGPATAMTRVANAGGEWPAFWEDTDAPSASI
jgi:hypothetical protein